MAKKGKRRWNSSRTQQKRQRSEKKTPETLMKEGNLKEAIRILTTQLALHPTDEKRSLLGRCLLDSGNYQAAAAAWLAISEKTDYDLLLIGYAFLHAEDWEQARYYLNESLALCEHPYTLYSLAKAHMQDHHYFYLDEITVSRVLAYLQKARSLPGCPAGVFLLLDDLLRYKYIRLKDREAIPEELNQTQILQEAFALYPDDEEVRIRYASRLYFPEKNYEAVLMVIAPLITRDDPPREALGYALASLVEAKLFERALQCLEKLQGEEMGHRSGIAKLRGDLLLALGRLDEAIACYQEESRRDDFVAKFIGIFSHAWTLILKGQMGLALSLAQSGVNLWFDRAGKFEGYEAFDSEPICIGRTHIGDDSPALYVKNVCERLLQDNDLDGSLRGQLCFLFYLYYETYYEMRSLFVWEQREAHARYLLEAERLFPHPAMYPSLESFYRWNGNLPSAVTYHLEYALCLYEYTPGDFEERFAEFEYYDEDEETEEKKQLAREDRVGIHGVAFAKLKACQSAAKVEAVFAPFFHSFWHQVLLDGNMYQEIADVLSIFSSEGIDTEDDQWDYAYSIWQLGNSDEAERIFRHYLANHPDNSATLLNLSIVLEGKKLVQEAAALIGRAIASDPDNELVSKRHAHLETELQRLEEEEAARQKQELFLRSAPERWRQVDDAQKKLLYIMTTAESWASLAQLASKAGLDEQACQKHWERLVELGMIFLARENLHQINRYILHFVKDEGLLLHHPALTSILKDIADIETAETLLKETQAHLQATVLGLSEQVGENTELRDKLIWHLYWKVERVQQTWLKKAFGLKDKELREITTKAWVKMICPACNQPHMVNVASRTEFKRVQDTSWQRYYAKCPSCKEAERQRQEEESRASWEASEKRRQELHTMLYRDYLQTPEWEARRKRIMRRDNYRCQVCNVRGVRLNVHHKTYERRGYEDDKDLITLCESCHTIFYEQGKLARN